jgi:hypothetical protein
LDNVLSLFDLNVYMWRTIIFYIVHHIALVSHCNQAIQWGKYFIYSSFLIEHKLKLFFFTNNTYFNLFCYLLWIALKQVNILHQMFYIIHEETLIFIVMQIMFLKLTQQITKIYRLFFNAVCREKKRIILKW